MTIPEIIAELDKNYATMSTADLEAWLIAQCAKYEAENPDDHHGRGALYNELGGFYRGHGIYDKGEAAFLKAKEALEELHMVTMNLEETICGCASCACSIDSTNQEKEKVPTPVLTNSRGSLDYATTLNNLAGLYRLSGAYDKALAMFDEAKETYDRIGGAPEDVYASCFNNKGLVYLDLKDGAQALACFEKAFAELATGAGNDIALATTYSNRAFARLLLGNRAEAAQDLQTAAEYFLKANGEQDEGYQYCKAAAQQLRDAQ